MAAETFVLVELEEIRGTWTFGEQVEQGTRLVIKRIIRTYLRKTRADDDLLLLREMLPAGHFDIQTIEHIDD